MTAQPTGVDLVREAARLARAVAAGRATHGDAEQLVVLGGKARPPDERHVVCPPELDEDEDESVGSE